MESIDVDAETQKYTLCFKFYHSPEQAASPMKIFAAVE